MFLITGATGTNGLSVVEQLMAVDKPVRVLVREQKRNKFYGTLVFPSQSSAPTPLCKICSLRRRPSSQRANFIWQWVRLVWRK